MGHVAHADHFPGLHEETTSDTASVAVMSLSAVATAWCAYQSSVWSGVQARHYVLAGKLNQHAMEAHLEGNQRMMFDGSMFLSYATARVDKKDELAGFLHDRFRPEMRVAVDAWLATKPLQNPEGPPSPLKMPEYQLDSWSRAKESAAGADREIDLGVQSNRLSETYVLATVILAVVLFFAGIGPKLPRYSSRRFAFWFSVVLLVGTLAWVATLPVELAH